MALVIVATPGATDANSFADLQAAEDLVQYQPESVGEAWDDLDRDQQVRALVSASTDIDALPWDDLRGDCPTSDEQALSWPRGGSSTLPANLVKATVVLALSRINAFGDDATSTDIETLNAESTSNIKREKVDVLETEYFAPSSEQVVLSAFPARVRLLLSALVKPVVSATTWGTGTARRAS